MNYRKLRPYAFLFLALWVLLSAFLLVIAISARADSDGPPSRMVRLRPDGLVHVGPITGMSVRVGYRGHGRARVLRTFRCRESRAIGYTWCAGRVVDGRMRAFAVYELVNQDLISYYTGDLRVFIWQP